MSAASDDRPLHRRLPCTEARLVIELDGGQHNEEADAARTAFLKDKRYRILRFWNTDVVENFEGVLDVILRALRD
ncbi:MAG: DUF559 domain-containing protein [Pseudomonadota bacterium]